MFGVADERLGQRVVAAVVVVTPSVPHPRWPSCARTSLQRCRRRPRRARFISSTSCPVAASGRWTGATRGAIRLRGGFSGSWPMVISDQSPPISTGFSTPSPSFETAGQTAFTATADRRSAERLGNEELRHHPIGSSGARGCGPGSCRGGHGVPERRDAADVVDSLKAEGYNVQVNGFVQVPLKLCTATMSTPLSMKRTRCRRSSTPRSSSTCRAPPTTDTSAASWRSC